MLKWTFLPLMPIIFHSFLARILERTELVKVFTCYLEIFKHINDWVAELVYFLNTCPVQFQSVWVLFPSQYFASEVQCCLYELLLGPASVLAGAWLASLRVSPVWPDYCYIAGCPPVDHHHCNVSSPGKTDHTNNPDNDRTKRKYCDLCDLLRRPTVLWFLQYKSCPDSTK